MLLKEHSEKKLLDPPLNLQERSAYFAYMIGGLIKNLLDASLKHYFITSHGPCGL